MAEETLTGGDVLPSICPWCSATYTGSPQDCPSCGAALTSDSPADASLPGLTAIDPAAIVRAKDPSPRSRNRLLSWISGEYPDDGVPATDLGALAPPDADVRREILRLELEAEVANLQAEADALMAEAAAEGRAPTATPEDAAAAETIVEELQSVSSELDEIDAALEAAPLTAAAEGIVPAGGADTDATSAAAADATPVADAAPVADATPVADAAPAPDAEASSPDDAPSDEDARPA